MKKILLSLLLPFFLITNVWAVGNDSNTVSLLHMNGTDGSTTFTDDAAGGTHTWTAVNQAQIDTAQTKFGTASGLFDGTGDYIDSADSADWYLSGDFTIDFWVRFSSISGTAKTTFLYQQTTDQDNCMWLFNDSGVEIEFRVVATGVVVVSVAKAWTPSTNTWYHVAVTRSGNSWRIFIDGAQIGTTTTDADNPANYTGRLNIGDNGPAGVGVNGWNDEFRISNIARWTANFTPATAEYDDQPAPSGVVAQAIFIQ